MTTTLRFVATTLAALTTFCGGAASALPIKEFRKFSPQEQATYITAAVSMVAYTNAANGNVAKASCIKKWYFGTKGADTPGPHEIAVEMGVAEHLDADKYHVEGVILGVTDKACPALTPAQGKP